jgi:uncharacterized coiled-coil protein SlyX
VTRRLDSHRPNLDALDPAEVERRKRLAAETGPPRDACPGCLRDLRPFPMQRRQGWCRFCVASRDEILSRLLRVTDPHWRLPGNVVALEATVAETERRLGEMEAVVENGRRHLAKLRANLRYLRVEMKVCPHCTRAPAGRSNLCRACEDSHVPSPT